MMEGVGAVLAVASIAAQFGWFVRGISYRDVRHAARERERHGD
jgi:hypothetical protein